MADKSSCTGTDKTVANLVISFNDGLALPSSMSLMVLSSNLASEERYSKVALRSTLILAKLLASVSLLSAIFHYYDMISHGYLATVLKLQ